MKHIIFSLIALLIIFSSCKEMEKGPLVVTNKIPGVLTNISVDNLPGTVKITYSLPDDPGVLYVEAIYHTGNGQQRIVRSSMFKNFFVLEGFNSTKEQNVTLYVVNRSENRSKPIQIKIKPLKAPIHFIFHSLKVRETFGGVEISFYNEAEKEYVLHTLIKDSTNTWIEYDRLYTSAKKRDYAIHGLPAEPTDFAFFFMDKWHNYSDTLFKTLTPLYEKELNKSLWKLYPLDNDTYKPLYSDRPIERIWDGSISSSPYAIDPDGAVLPSWITIDLGQKSVFSRFRFNAYYKPGDTKFVFRRGTPSEFEIWGSNNPGKDGNWDDWTLLGRIKSVKPSGLPVGQLSNEDIAAAIAGVNFTFPYTGTAYRYIRFKTINTWGNRPDIFFGEITLWGQPQ